MSKFIATLKREEINNSCFSGKHTYRTAQQQYCFPLIFKATNEVQMQFAVDTSRGLYIIIF